MAKSGELLQGKLGWEELFRIFGDCSRLSNGCEDCSVRQRHACGEVYDRHIAGLPEWLTVSEYREAVAIIGSVIQREKVESEFGSRVAL